MKRTGPAPLLALAAAGVLAGYLFDLGLAASGRPVIVPPVTLPIALVLIGVIVIALAWPVRKAVRDDRVARIDPFYATRVVVLAKASSLAGALLAGLGLGVTLYLLSRAVVPGVGSVLLAIAAAVGAILLMIAALIAEWMCVLPPADDSAGGEIAPAPQ